MFKQASGMKYARFLRQLHRQHVFDWYLEVGCRTGKSFATVRSKTIAVDPFFRIERDVIAAKPALHILQMKSDDFFASGFISAIKAELSFSFLDGMHLYEYLLRDFMNAERASRRDGVIALHDCCPFSDVMTTRDIDNLPDGAWTGDVWKLLPILKEFRPDLEVTVLDCAPTGLVLISGLDPSSRVLDDNYDAILARYDDLTLETFGHQRFAECFEYTDAEDYARAGFAHLAGLALPQDAVFTPVRIT